MVVWARLVLAPMQTNHRCRRDAAAVTPPEPQSRESRVWLVVIKTAKKFVKLFNK